MIISIELQKAVKAIESDEDDEYIRNWILMLIAPGTSLGELENILC